MAHLIDTTGCCPHCLLPLLAGGLCVECDWRLLDLIEDAPAEFHRQKCILATKGVRHTVGRLSFRQRSIYYGRMPGVALRWLNAPEGTKL